MRPQIVIILALVLSIVDNTPMLAQLRSGETGPPPPENQRGPELPIDNGILILLIIGLLYGCYVIWKKYKINKTRSAAE